MLSKFLHRAGWCAPLFNSKVVQSPVFVGMAHKIPVLVPQPLALPIRPMSHLIPPSQYDMPLSKKLKILYVMQVYWETIPLFVTTFFAIFVVFCAVTWACNNKVDIVFSAHSRQNISRTMDLRNPSVHKIVIINQRYPPWPEMQDVLDKMVDAEKRALTRAQSCATP